MEIHEHQFEHYVKRIYHGSHRPLKYSHLKKGAILQYSLKNILDEQEHDYVEESEVGKGPDFVVGISPNLVPIECKNEKYHTESPKSVEIDIISRFKDYPKSSPKILLTSKVKYPLKARKRLDEYNIQIIVFPEDINDYNELNKFRKEIFALIKRSLYKFSHYKKYKPHLQSSEQTKGVDISFNNAPLFLPHYHSPLISTTTPIYYHPPPTTINYLVLYLILYLILVVYTGLSVLPPIPLSSILIPHGSSYIPYLILLEKLCHSGISYLLTSYPGEYVGVYILYWPHSSIGSVALAHAFWASILTLSGYP